MSKDMYPRVILKRMSKISIMQKACGQFRNTMIMEKLGLKAYTANRLLNELCKEGKLKKTLISGQWFFARPQHEFDETKVKRKIYKKQVVETAIKYNETLIKKWV